VGGEDDEQASMNKQTNDRQKKSDGRGIYKLKTAVRGQVRRLGRVFFFSKSDFGVL
jgi:hypothetical protein